MGIKKTILYSSMCLGVAIALVFGMRVNSQGIVDVAVYTGSGTWQDSITTMENFLKWKGLSFEEVNAWGINHGKLTNAKYRALFMPGGWAFNYKQALNAQGNQYIRNFVANGGGYIGTCAGAYYAADYVVWNGTKYDYPLGLFKGYAQGPISEIAPWPNYAMTTLQMEKSNPINQYEPASEAILYYGGPVFVPDASQQMNPLAYWSAPKTDWANQKAGVVAFPYGKGRVVLFGPHPEIEENSSRDGSNFAADLDDEGSDWPLLWTSFDWLLSQPLSQPKELPDTNPPVIQSVAGDPNPVTAGNPITIVATILDAMRVRSASVAINGTAYPMTRSQSVLLSDGFESGNVGAAWSLYGLGKQWAVSNENPFEGLYHLQAKATGSSKSSYAEVRVSTAGFSDAEVSYARKLVGLDAADEFSVDWFDGTGWHVLEQTGSNAADDAAYTVKKVILPKEAANNPNFSLRFMCMAGAISEKCLVDNVSVKGFLDTWTYQAATDTLRAGSYGYSVSAVDLRGNASSSANGEFIVQ